MKRKVGVLYPVFCGGGAEAVALRIISCLSRKYEVHLYTLFPVSRKQFVARYDIDIGNTVEIHALFGATVERWSRYIFEHIASLHVIRQGCLWMWYRRYENDYFCSISGYNEMPFYRNGIQYVHYPGFCWNNRVLRLIFGYSKKRIQNTLTLVNSTVTQQAYTQRYQSVSHIVYPPVTPSTRDVSWKSKKDLFVMSGRLVKTKLFIEGIDILQKVRAQGYNVELCIVGQSGNRRYVRCLQELSHRYEWLTICEGLDYNAYRELLSTARYGLHLRREPFGISVGEMIMEGCLPFVPYGGGQLDLVEGVDELCFNSVTDSADRIACVLSDEKLQQKLRQSLKRNKQRFSSLSFDQSIQSFVQSIDDTN